MRWRSGRRSSNVDDRRGRTSGFGMPGGGRRGGGLKVGGVGGIVLILVAMYFGVDPAVFLGDGGPVSMSPGNSSAPAQPRSAAENEMAEFVSVVLADTEDTWNKLFADAGSKYPEPTLVLFTGRTNTACGLGQAATGPFYCPGDRQVYIDLSFFNDLAQRFGAPGDFAQAYVIAHEVGHHIQTVTGISSKVQQAERGRSQADQNALSVRQELQADCFAGIWAHHADRTRNILEKGDVEEALNAASAIGDDRLQKQARGVAVPESFTHGSSAQRQRWFRQGLETGSLEACDTFSASRL